MAAPGDTEANVEREREIPVFTVVKNSAILKNIFLINSGLSISAEDSSKTCQDSEQTLLVGRHPDCDIRLEHPSISRFHLRIHSKPSSKRLSVTDLSSVHGTWISGMRIEPDIQVDVNEGDALRIGGSSRVYRLHWIPFHKAYISDNPFVTPLDVPPPDEGKEEETKERDTNALVLENATQSVNFTSPKYNQFETLDDMEDVNILLCKNEDEKCLELGCECSLDSALEAIKALISNRFEGSKDMQDESAQIIDEKAQDSLAQSLGFYPYFKPPQEEEEEVISAAPLPEAMKALDMPLESRVIQLVNFAWEGKEILLLHTSPLLVALKEKERSLAMQEDDYSHDLVAKYEGMPLVLKSTKENQTPNYLQEHKSEKHPSAKCVKLSVPSTGEEMPLQTLFADSPQKSTSNSLTSGGATLSACCNKENQTPNLLQEKKSARHPSAGHTKLFLLRKQEAETPPFQTLYVDSPEKSRISGVSASTKYPSTCENSMDKNKNTRQKVKRWTMLVDIASLLDKTSRKALQLLEGIKGTQLIIPRAVVSELDAMKQQADLVRRSTEAYLASRWIEECVDRTKWWIRIESCMENEGRSAAVPSSTSYCAYGTLPEQVSPSMEDRVLDYALYLRRIQNDGQLVLLGDDTTMKIKAMAAGLICETAEEFRESLVNPFSKRFLWADSLPRGRTWSYLDDVIRIETLHPGAVKTTLKGVEKARGLKLILLLHSFIY